MQGLPPRPSWPILKGIRGVPHRAETAGAEPFEPDPIRIGGGTGMLDSRAVTVVGAGVAGTWQALLFAKAGFDVTVVERGDASLAGAAAYWAGGMLAPGCEAETAEPIVTRLGRRSLELWHAHGAGMTANGSLVVAHPRDRADYQRFARLTSGYERVDGSGSARSSRRWRAASARGFSSLTRRMSSRGMSCRPCTGSSRRQARRSASTRPSSRDVSTAPSSTAAALRRAMSFPICAACAAKSSWSRPPRSACRGRCG